MLFLLVLPTTKTPPIASVVYEIIRHAMLRAGGDFAACAWSKIVNSFQLIVNSQKQKKPIATNYKLLTKN